MKAEQQFLCDLAEKISMPDIYLKIRILLNKPHAKIDDYVDLLQSDSMLAIRIMRIANSEFFGFKRKADDLYEAISLIGVIQLHDLLLSSLCMRTFSNIPESILDVKDFWQHAVKCGIASRTIAKLCRLPAGNRFFTIGLLLEIGHAAMFVKAPELALEALLDSQQKGLPVDQMEREYFGFDYCQLGAEIMHLWHLPEVYSHLIGHHLDPEKTDPVYRNEAYIVHLAQQMFVIPNRLSHLIGHMQAHNQQFAAFPENLEEIIANEIDAHGQEVFAILMPPNTNSKDDTMRETQP
ncbi:MAG: HDOD domain-containing protein [Methylomicrobium sp.]|nr:HDOD domain-containing protein [Methylomicrobium sp.]